MRVQIQMYNLFNQVEFREMNAQPDVHHQQGTSNNSSNTGKYTSATNPFNGGITLRFDY